MNTTRPTQKTLPEILDEIEHSANDCNRDLSRGGHNAVLISKVPKLVKALQYAHLVFRHANDEEAISNLTQLLTEPADSKQEVPDGETEHPRVEQCVKCQQWTSDWVDPDGAGGRICRYCEAFHLVKPEAVADNVKAVLQNDALKEALPLLEIVRDYEPGEPDGACAPNRARVLCEHIQKLLSEHSIAAGADQVNPPEKTFEEAVRSVECYPRPPAPPALSVAQRKE